MTSSFQEAILAAASAPPTDRYGVIGNPISHSKSPAIHAAFAQQTGQHIRYDRIYAELIAFEETVLNFVREGGRGLNVTVPFKLDAYAMSTSLSLRAESAGAVNTFKFDGDEIFGDNTDGVGLMRDITHNIGNALVGERVLLLGAGGAARGVLLPLLEHKPARVFIANRTADRAVSLVQRFEVSAKLHEVELVGGGYDELAVDDVFDVIINATASSLQAQVPPVPATVFGPNALAYDMMYGAQPTLFMQFAKRHGARAWDGLGMLVEQAAESFFVWRGVRPDTGPVLHAMREGLQGEAAVAARAPR
ncbi:Shikimate dehydrogenase (NADP(+)) [Ralstonia condita]|uniref:Shikimate dehydrogenase (NADP(+)) n=1 Tax=Ralstonia condita TaxID=3058600 RepID=A0ABM9IWH0_9RALS|nr:shikimate dehydrogenase [Ralstonia sp. LMG 7141]CAJ0774216.1 Shikimate dehydrogenase (NADP(+)) [Ralstonia sp. LMG 7141]